MNALPREIGGLLPWAPSARWYSAKGRCGPLVLYDSVRILPQGRPAEGASIWLALVDRLDGASDRFVMPLEERNGDLADAAGTPAFASWLVETVREERCFPGTRGMFRGRSTGAALLATPRSAAIRVTAIGGDASNTSLLVEWESHGVVVKLLRRCRSGVHPEVELGGFLATAPLAAGVPRLLGWLEHGPGGETGAERETGVLATVHEKVDAIGSAWEVSLDRAVADWPRCLALVASLGEATARMHAALTSRADPPAFAPEPWSRVAWGSATRRMAEHAAAVFERLVARCGDLPAATRSLLEPLLARRQELVSRFENATEAATRPPSESMRIRVHGDYHLGQVLVTREGERCAVIDFEGEPGRSLEERREKTSAAKDVAGMCRSFDYLLRVLAKEGRRPYREEDLHDLEAAYLSAYESVSNALVAAGPKGVRWWPEDGAEAATLLAAFTLDKAVYELAYEADNRPDWIDVPLAALVRILDG